MLITSTFLVNRHIFTSTVLPLVRPAAIIAVATIEQCSFATHKNLTFVDITKISAISRKYQLIYFLWGMCPFRVKGIKMEKWKIAKTTNFDIFMTNFIMQVQSFYLFIYFFFFFYLFIYLFIAGGTENSLRPLNNRLNRLHSISKKPIFRRGPN